MSRDYDSLLDIYQAGQRVISYAEGLSQSELEADGMRVSAILYQVLIIGEATKRLSRELRDQHPEIPWNSMAGMRDILAHHYDEIDFDQTSPLAGRNVAIRIKVAMIQGNESILSFADSMFRGRV